MERIYLGSAGGQSEASARHREKGVKATHVDRDAADHVCSTVVDLMLFLYFTWQQRQYNNGNGFNTRVRVPVPVEL